MDVTTLLYRHRNTRPNEYNRKRMALRTAYSIVRTIDSGVSTDEFLRRSIDTIGRVFGGTAQDSYLTTIMSVVKTFQPDVDVYLAGVINAIVLQMNFQTRIFLDGNQSIIFDGDRDYFPLAMLHGNLTLGICTASEAGAVSMPIWANVSPSLEINPDRLHVLPPEQVRVYQAASGCKHTGALLITNPDVNGGAFSIAERYSYLKETVSAETIYCVAGSAEMVLKLAAELQQAYPDLRVNVKAYANRRGRALEYRAILVFSGIDQIPEVAVQPGVARACTFGHNLANNDGYLTSISYGEGSIAGRNNHDGGLARPEMANGVWEKAPVRRPFLLSSSAPLPMEARERVSDELEVFHSVLAIRDGILIPSQDSSHATFLYATGDGKVISDYGSDPAGTPLYEAAQVGGDGIRRGYIRSSKLRRVRGAVMPLMFTPLLHKWHSHFMIQCLPRTRIVRDLAEEVSILLPYDLRRKQLEMLELLGFGNERIVKMEPGELIQAETLYYPWPWRLAFTEYSAAVYDEIASKVEVSHISTPKRILISRESRKSWRNLINYDAVRQMLVEDYGFEVVAPEKLTLAEEIATYANAEIVVGAEGAGMYGAVFSNKTTKYITICDEDYVMPILGSLAAVRDFEIGYVFGESLRSDRDVGRRLLYGHADFVIDIDKLGQAVRLALGK